MWVRSQESRVQTCPRVRYTEGANPAGIGSRDLPPLINEQNTAILERRTRQKRANEDKRL